MRVQRIPWKRPAPPPADPSPWGGRVASLLLLVAALTLVWHGTQGRRVLTDLATWARGQMRPAAAVTPGGTYDQADVLARISAQLAELPALLRSGSWDAVKADLALLNTEWDGLAGRLARYVPAFDVNNFTVLLADLSADVAVRNVTRALGDVRSARLALSWLETAYVASQSASLTELRQLSADLSQAVARQDWRRVRQDAQALSVLVRHVEKGE